MAVREIIRMGHPILRQRARELTADEIRSPALGNLIEDMVDTLAASGGIGLAAPQIAEPVRLAIIRITGGPSRYGEIAEVPLTIYVNPTIEIRDAEEQGFWEGCLSVPGLRGYVERPRGIRVRWQNLDGQPQTADYQGFLATVFQHEFDHLDGHLYIDRMKDSTQLVFEEEFARYGNPAEAID
ncbi:MAG: peptide deformylase [Gammaproteobacteria bacterium]|nr:peptide deformylase [Gammaproteobacteria bacterium]